MGSHSIPLVVCVRRSIPIAISHLLATYGIDICITVNWLRHDSANVLNVVVCGDRNFFVTLEKVLLLLT